MPTRREREERRHQEEKHVEGLRVWTSTHPAFRPMWAIAHNRQLYGELVRMQYWGRSNARMMFNDDTSLGEDLIVDRGKFYREMRICQSLDDPYPHFIEVYMDLWMQYMNLGDHVVATLDAVELYVDVDGHFVFVSHPSNDRLYHEADVQQRKTIQPYDGDAAYTSLGWTKWRDSLNHPLRHTYVKTFNHKRSISNYYGFMGSKFRNRASLEPDMLQYFLSL
jgi:hypothetical protein